MEANEKMKKDLVVGTIYSVRAGLSYISTLVDEIKAKDESIASYKTANEQIKKKIENNSKKLEDHKKSVTKMENDLKNVIETKEEAESLIDDLRNKSIEKYDYYKTRRPYQIKADISLILLVGAVFVLLFNIISNNTHKTVFKVFCVLTALLFVWFLVSIILLRRKTKSLMADKNEVIKKNECYVKNCLKRISKLNNSIAETLEDMPNYIAKIQEKNEKLKAEIEKNKSTIVAIRKEKTNLGVIGRRIYKTLVNTYGDSIHPDNWKYIDRILYYLISGRADNLRDALNLMDQRLNAEMIANEMKVASDAIGKEIRRTGKEIKDSIANCAATISESVYKMGGALLESNIIVAKKIDETNRINAVIADGVEKTNQLLGEVIETNEKRINVQELSNALQAKANVTMDQILRECQSINC